MTKGQIICGLDIGTNNVKVLAAVIKPESGELEVVGQGEAENSGMRKGVVINTLEVSRKIREAIDTCQENLAKPIRRVLVNINGSHLIFMPSRGLVSVSRADQKISEADIERALNASRSTLSLSANQEILTTLAQEFVIDGQAGVKEALGLRGIRLEVKALCPVVWSPYLKNLTEAVLGADLEIENIVPSILASSQAVLDPKEKELGVAVVEIGAGNTSLAVFEEGTLVHAAVFPLGSNNITNDIAFVLKTEIEAAERIKREFAGFGLRHAAVKKQRRSISAQGAAFSQKALSKVIEARTKEILGELFKELKKIGKTELPSGVVLTGGGVKLPRLVDFAKRELRLPCRLGYPRGFVSELDDPAWSVAAGLVLDGARSLVEDRSGGGIIERIKGILNIFAP